ncbi:MAG: ASKHA domain-containing protein [Clostridia bacterium]
MNYNVTIKKGETVKNITVSQGTLISDILDDNHVHTDYPCAKKGICKKCLVHVNGEISEVSTNELSLGTLLEEGYRLACCTHILGDCTLTLEEKEQTLQTADNKITVKIDEYNPMFEKYGLAVDIGTTTLSACILHGQEVLATENIKNPQIAYGADVISRIEQQLDGKTDELADKVIGGINYLTEILTAKLNISINDIDAAVITGNTVMLYLLTSRNCKPLSAAPFKADYLGDEFVSGNFSGLTLSQKCKIYLPPCIAAFVGADITTAILASKITKQEKTNIMVDIGTNGEMALWHENKLYCCSTAAGPAFEGVGIKHGMYGVTGAIQTVSVKNGDLEISTIGDVKAKGICGSGVVDSISTMLDLEIIDDTGRMEETNDFAENFVKDDGLTFLLSNGVGICEQDVRAIQLAKSAICAGLVTLIKDSKLSFDKIDTLHIAGGFGSYLNLINAGKIGLIPNELVPKVNLLGNAALTGAQMILLNKNNIDEVRSYSKGVNLLDLATSQTFMQEYMDNMFFDV